MKIYKTWFGKRFRTLRTKAGFSQETFAQEMDVKTASVSRWETGDSFPETEEKFQKICALLKCKESDFLILPPPTPQEKAWLGDIITRLVAEPGLIKDLQEDLNGPLRLKLKNNPKIHGSETFSEVEGSES